MKRLTGRQRTVLDMLAAGASDLEVCKQLGLALEELTDILDQLEHAAATRPSHHKLVSRFEHAARMRAERRAKAVGSRFGALLEASPLAVLVVDGQTGEIKSANEYATQMFGYPAKELTGRCVEDLLSPSLKTKHVAFRFAFLASVRRRELGYHPPIFAVRADGTFIELSIALTATEFDNEVMVVCTEFLRPNPANAVEETVANPDFAME